MQSFITRKKNIVSRVAMCVGLQNQMCLRKGHLGIKGKEFTYWLQPCVVQILVPQELPWISGVQVHEDGVALMVGVLFTTLYVTSWLPGLSQPSQWSSWSLTHVFFSFFDLLSPAHVSGASSWWHSLMVPKPSSLPARENQTAHGHFIPGMPVFFSWRIFF